MGLSVLVVNMGKKIIGLASWSLEYSSSMMVSSAINDNITWIENISALWSTADAAATYLTTNSNQPYVPYGSWLNFKAREVVRRLSIVVVVLIFGRLL